MNSSARNIFPSLQLRPTSFVKTLSILGIFIVVISYSYWSHLANIKGVFTHLKPTPAQKLADHGWTQNIWQTSKYPAENISSENEKYMRTWTDLNPGYQHKVLTDELIAGYVRDHFHASNPDIEEAFFRAKDFVLQLDLIKYMVLWSEGGAYSDLDVACVQPISQWVPPQFIDKAGIVLGMQIEQKAGIDGSTKESFQLADWTIMSKPNQPFLWFLYQRFAENIKHLAAEQIVPAPNSRPYNISDVTGRNALTQAFLAYATSVTATKVTANNFTKVTEPILFGEILVLPVQAFASPFQNGKEFVHHYDAGSRKSEPWDKLQPSVNEEQKEKEPEENEVAEEEKSVEAEKQKQKQEDMNTTGGDQNSEEENVGVSEEKAPSPPGNITTKGKVGQLSVNGTAEPSKPPVEANKAFPADEKKPSSDKPPSVQYENAQVKDKPTTNDKPPSVQYENVKVAENVTDTRHNTSNSASQHSTNDNTNTENAIDKDTATKAEDETEAKEEAEKLKAQAAAKKAAEAKKEEEEKKAAEAQKKKEEEGEQRLAEEEAKKAAEAQKKKEEEKRLEEEQKKKTAEQKWAPLNEAGKLVSSNNLADGAEFVPSD